MLEIENLLPISSFNGEGSSPESSSKCSPDLMHQIKKASFLDESLQGRERSRFFINGGPDHVLTVKQTKGVMGETIHVFVSGEIGPTIISVADKVDVRGNHTTELDEVYVDGHKGENPEDAMRAVRNIEAIFPNYSLVQELVVDASGIKYINGELQTYDAPSEPTPLQPEASSVIAS